MNDYPYNFGRGGAIGTAETRNRVLRNTYWLLALSMVPTVLGAWVGVATGFSLFAATSPMMSLLAFFAIAFGFMFAIERTKNSSAGVFVLLGFTFFMGLMLSRLLSFILGFSNGPSLIMLAFGGTGVIFAAMATVATVSKRDFGPRQMALRRRDRAAARDGREHVPATAGADADRVGARDRDLLGVHAV